jgi:ribosomal protein L11 methyltransferase
LLEAYVESRAAAVALKRLWGGRYRAVNTREWLKMLPAPPTRIGQRLEIVHEKPRSRSKSKGAQLYIPHGLAFGSGEHATTYMLLRELARRADLSRMAVLDLGTGSGVLALTARLLGARKIVATDFDPDAVRTAGQNEARNFEQPLIRWRRADVRKLRASATYDLVLANLFSGILAEAAAQIAACVSPGGELWLSGILSSQEKEVAATYGGQGMELIRAFRRGKWVMLRLARLRQGEPGPVGGMKNATQIK